MDATLEAPSTPIAISDCSVSKEEVGFSVQCHDRVFKNVTVLDEDGQELFTAESRGVGSWSWRRTVKSKTSGVPLFDLLHPGVLNIKNNWMVQTPDGREMCTLNHVSFMGKERSALDMVLRNEADNGNEITLHIRPQDRSAITTLVTLENTTIAEIRLMESNDVSNLTGKDRSLWKARVAGRVDTAIVSYIRDY